MLKRLLLRLIGRVISCAMLGPVHRYGAPLGRAADTPDVILVPHRLGPTDCWLFWARLGRAPIFIDKSEHAECWGHRWLNPSRRGSDLPEGSLLDRMQYWLDNRRTLVVTLDISSQEAVDAVSDQLRRLVAYRKSLTVQVVTFNYDFRSLLGSPVHWIWRDRALNLGQEPLLILQELQALQKQAWSIKGYQTLLQFPLLQPSGRIPSSLLLSWHEVRARRSWRWPSLAGWLWMPVAAMSTALNAVPLTIAWWSCRSGAGWPAHHMPNWLGPVYLVNQLCILVTLAHHIGWLSLVYLPWLLIGLHPLGKLADALVDQAGTADSRDMRERIMNYFE